MLSHVFLQIGMSDRARWRPVFYFHETAALPGENNNTNMEGSIKMIDRFIKRFVKMFMPSPETLAKMASKQI